MKFLNLPFLSFLFLIISFEYVIQLKLCNLLKDIINKKTEMIL